MPQRGGKKDTDNGGKKNRVALANHHSLRTPPSWILTCFLSVGPAPKPGGTATSWWSSGRGFVDSCPAVLNRHQSVIAGIFWGVAGGGGLAGLSCRGHRLGTWYATLNFLVTSGRAQETAQRPKGKKSRRPWETQASECIDPKPYPPCKRFQTPDCGAFSPDSGERTRQGRRGISVETGLSEN